MTDQLQTVPVEPTYEMRIAGAVAIKKHGLALAVQHSSLCYKAMLAAAPDDPLCGYFIKRDLLADKHTGARISAGGILGRIREGRYYKELNFGCGTLLRHLEQMASRFYAGDVKAVDEFLQLYDLDDDRPNNVEPPNA
jgi:hypothetical protein